MAEDLRHEVTHGYLHTMVPHLPLWLDEGLAEYYEVPRGQAGLNPPHLQCCCGAEKEKQWKPDLAQLEQLNHPSDMTQQHYAEAWAWMHFLLTTTPERRETLCSHLARIRMAGTAPAAVADSGRRPNRRPLPCCCNTCTRCSTRAGHATVSHTRSRTKRVELHRRTGFQARP